MQFASLYVVYHIKFDLSRTFNDTKCNNYASQYEAYMPHSMRHIKRYNPRKYGTFVISPSYIFIDGNCQGSIGKKKRAVACRLRLSLTALKRTCDVVKGRLEIKLLAEEIGSIGKKTKKGQSGRSTQ